MKKDAWICLKCKYKWVNSRKADPRVCPLCGSCIIYCPKIIKVQKKEVSKVAPLPLVAI